ncbi:phosphatase 2C [Musa troglodytarum]|uniref:protein-serine/threonine phosphatase n=1 Tax=Musa troglodytarum TaxID=320322 RepID=A0A9E7EJQ7_9LILI|nr:phosphatase 2C [Musa troglodytarum]
MAGGDGERRRRHSSGAMVPLALLIGEEARMEKMERPRIRYGCAAQSKKGEDYFLIRTDCCRVSGDPSSSFSVFAVLDGHNGNAAAIYTRDNLLNHVMGAIPHGLGREEWLQALPRALIGPLRCWPGGLCLSRSIGDMDVGEFIVPVPYVKQIKLLKAGGRLIIASDGIWDALTSDTAANSCRGLPAELAARQVVKARE